MWSIRTGYMAHRTSRVALRPISRKPALPLSRRQKTDRRLLVFRCKEDGTYLEKVDCNADGDKVAGSTPSRRGIRLTTNSSKLGEEFRRSGWYWRCPGSGEERQGQRRMCKLKLAPVVRQPPNGALHHGRSSAQRGFLLSFPSRSCTLTVDSLSFAS